MADLNANPGGGQDQPQEPPPFDPSAEHMQRPKVRAIQGFPVQHQGQQLLGLRDPTMLSERVVFTSPAAMQLIPMLDGSKTVDEIVAQVGQGLTRQMMEGIVAQLDGALLLEGPTFDSHLSQLQADFEASDILPPAGTAQLADMLVLNARRQAYMAQKESEGQTVTPQDVMQVPPQELEKFEAASPEELLVKQMDAWIDKALEQAEDPSFDTLPKGIAAPHIDYVRGWPNYAHIYGRMRVVDRPERILILGTNHHGRGTGVVACSKGYESPLGVCQLDKALLNNLVAELNGRGGNLGAVLLEQEFDHEREYSIEMQIPWIQHIFGQNEAGEFVPVVGALVHDISRTQDGDSYDGKGVGLMPFVESARNAIASLPGKTLVLASADLSHVGPQFGDKEPVNEARRNEVAKHDQEMIEHLKNNEPEALVSSMAWQQNPTRWCSVGNLVAAMKIVDPKNVKMLSYSAAADPQGVGCVSSLAMAMF